MKFSKNFQRSVVLAPAFICGIALSSCGPRESGEDPGGSAPEPQVSDAARPKADEKKPQDKPQEKAPEKTPEKPVQVERKAGEVKLEPAAPAPPLTRERSIVTFASLCAGGKSSALLSRLKTMFGFKDCNDGQDKLFKVAALFLDGGDIDDISILQTLGGLRKLSLENTKVRDVSPLAELEKLEYLSLRGSPVKDVGPLVRLAALKVLQLDRTEVLNYEPLTQLPRLELAFYLDKVHAFRALTQSPSTARLSWNSGDGVCFGGWNFKEYRTCDHPSFGVELYKLARTSHCPIQEKVTVYKQCEDPSHGFSGKWRRIDHHVDIFRYAAPTRCDHWLKELEKRLGPNQRLSDYKRSWAEATDSNNKKVTVLRCEADRDEKVFKTDRSRACGVERVDDVYQQCRHSSHGVEKYFARKGPVCGASGNIVLSSPLTKRDDILKSEGEPVECITCDDINVSNVDDIGKKLQCIKSNLAKNFSNPVTQELVSAAKLLYGKFKDKMTGDEVHMIQALDAKYPAVGYPGDERL